ncbi:hypothetical protein OZX57_03850 [Bifidobacterium sp. ESL0682]|uniref:hypothetical protein n=1 Tax=Bifidobacterium sp. ESL0682 TaxID=2983212 RepID=UPI0023F890BC|nr:hypothetical protein [Bifidobacterium sp. ESL0682]WEV42567.1 hypothetical protein OZX57_03850 [Bifidobacterium sp. ESL0682]
MNNENHQASHGKALTATIIVIVLILVGGFTYQLGRRHALGGNNAASTSQQTTMKRVGILQYVSHPALNQIHKGVVDELKKKDSSTARTSRSSTRTDRPTRASSPR